MTTAGAKRWLQAIDLREEAIALALLAAALAVSDRVLFFTSVPTWAELAVVALGSQMAVWHPPPAGGPWWRFAARLPSMLAVAASAALVYCRILRLPPLALAFIPLWFGLEAAYRVGWLVHRERVLAWWRHRLEVRSDRSWGAIALAGTMVYFGSCYYPGFWPRLLRGAIAREHFVVLGWTVVALTSYLAGLRLAARRSNPAAENLRWIAICAAACLLLRGFLRFTLVGGGDAGWYGTMLADMIAQTRAGIFPVWAGQSEYQFNGAIYPLRVAPAFHYLGALLDALTFRSLGVFALQNLLLTMLGLATAYSAYFTLAALLPGRRWTAAGLALLFLACPGVVGIAYISDLFMSWTTLPWVPLVWFATVRSFRNGGSAGSLLLLGTSLGLCWWGHSPIALWLTLLASAAQLARMLGQKQRPRIRPIVAGVAAFAAIAAYPIGSVLIFPPEPAVKAYAFQEATPGNIAHFVSEAFPADLLPVSFTGRELGDLQLGYALWALLLLGLWHWRRMRASEARVLLAAAGLIAVLLTPIPGMDLLLWKAIPGFVRNPTGNWAMNRLYLILAGLTTYGIAAAVAGDWLKGQRRALGILVALGCAWSLAEAARFSRISVADSRPAASAVDLLRPENVAITRFSYLVFPHEPGYFTHGVADPALENRLRREPAGPLIADNLSAALEDATPVGRGVFAPDASNYALQVPAPFRLDPGRRYLLAFDFLNPARARGDLQIFGATLARDYALPEFGEAASFGIGGRHANALPVQTSNPSGESVSLRFLPEHPGRAATLLPFARVTLLAFDPARLPVQVFSWMPYRAHVIAREAAWLETPRMYQRGYAAWVNGRPVEVRKSGEGLVSIPVPAGRAEVKVKYLPPPGLEILFWFSLAGISVCGGTLAAKTIRQTLRPAP